MQATISAFASSQQLLGVHCNCAAFTAIGWLYDSCPGLPFVYHLCSDELNDSPFNHNSSAATPWKFQGYHPEPSNSSGHHSPSSQKSWAPTFHSLSSWDLKKSWASLSLGGPQCMEVQYFFQKRVSIILRTMFSTQAMENPAMPWSCKMTTKRISK